MNKALQAGLAVLGLAFAAAGGWAARDLIPTPQHAMHAEALPSGTQATHNCRQGAFVEASETINAVTDVMLNMPASTPKVSRMGLDTVLYTALRQAGSEVHCVAGVLQHGYGRVYADVVRRGAMLARSRGLPKDVVALANRTAEALERNQPVQPNTLARTHSGAHR